MPLYTTKIDLIGDRPYVSCAKFLSFLAYPEESDDQRRWQLECALQCWAIRLKSAADPDWAQQPQLIVPNLLAVNQVESEKTQKRGYKLICDRLICANGILFPALRDLNIGRRTGGQEYLILNKIFPVIDWKAESVSTYKSRVWRPSRPVTPAAGALLNWMLEQNFSAESVAKVWLDLFFSVANLRGVLDRSEEFRLAANEVQHYRLAEGDTIKFEVAG